MVDTDFKMTISKFSTSKDHIFRPVLTWKDFYLTVQLSKAKTAVNESIRKSTWHINPTIAILVGFYQTIFFSKVSEIICAELKAILCVFDDFGKFLKFWTDFW